MKRLDYIKTTPSSLEELRLEKQLVENEIDIYHQKVEQSINQITAPIMQIKDRIQSFGAMWGGQSFFSNLTFGWRIAKVAMRVFSDYRKRKN